jgi:hypothetical protein
MEPERRYGEGTNVSFEQSHRLTAVRLFWFLRRLQSVSVTVTLKWRSGTYSLHFTFSRFLFICSSWMLIVAHLVDVPRLLWNVLISVRVT